MRIVLDLQGCQSLSRLRGIGRYTLSLAKGIARNAGEHEVWLLLNDLLADTVLPLRREFAGLVPAKHIVVFSANGPVAECHRWNSTRTRVAELVREYALAELRPDVVHVSSLFEGYIDDPVTSIGCLATGIPTAVTLYDLIPLLNPESYLSSLAFRDHYLRKIESLKRADLLLAISESAAQEAISALDFPGARVKSIATAADDRFRPVDLSPDSVAELFGRFNLSRPFALYVGAIEPRKNFEGLIRAYAALPRGLRATHQLLLIGQGQESARDALRRLAASLDLRKDEVVVGDRVSDEDLVALYNLCRLLVFPSLHEGFGLPVLEAMACGAAAIGSNTSSIPEVVGRDDALFDPRSPAAIAETMHRALADEAFHQSLREHGLRQAKKFSWDASARRALAAFEELHEGRRQAATVQDPSDLYRRLVSAVAGMGSSLSDLDLLRTADAIAANRAPGGHRQLLVDISALSEYHSGSDVQQASISILRALLLKPPDGFLVKPIRFDRSRARYRHALALAQDVPGWPLPSVADEWVEACRGDVFLGLDPIPDSLPQAKSTLLQLRRRGVQVCFVIYHLIPLSHPEWCDQADTIAMEDCLRTIMELSDSLAVVSQDLLLTIQDWLASAGAFFPTLPAFALFSLGSSSDHNVPVPEMSPEVHATLAQIARDRTFLMVGAIERWKGYAQVLSAFETLWSRGLPINLFIIGSQGRHVDDLIRRLRAHPQTAKRLFWLERIPTNCLPQVYASATCLIAASEFPGLDISVREAASHALPIIARDLPAFRDATQDSAHYFVGTSDSALSDAIIHWLALNAAGVAPSHAPIPTPTWAESASQLLAVLLDRPSDPMRATQLTK